MKVRDYLLDNEIITSGVMLMHPYITSDGKNSINNKFLFELGDLSMYFENESDIIKAVNYVLLKNKLKYTKIDETLKLALPLDYMRLITHTGNNTEDVDKTINILGGSSTTIESSTTLDKTVKDDVINSDNRSVNVLGENSSDVDVTNTNDINNQSVESGKVFDTGVGEWTEIKKVIDTNTNPSTSKTLGVDSVSSDSTETGGSTVDGTSKEDTTTIIESLTGVDSHSDTVDKSKKVGSENFTEKEQSIEVLEKIEKYRMLYSVSLWDVIVEDLKAVLCLRIWE